MGGKHKQAQRTKNNARPSSSGRSAELLGNSIPQFTGFSTIKDTCFPIPTLTLATSDDLSDSAIDSNFQLVMKKMNKKDSTTKLKALQEFTDLVKTTDQDAIKNILIYWSRLYNILSTDADHKVREATHLAHHQVVLKAKRNLAPYLKQLVGPWFTSQYDTYAPAASAATKSFEDAFQSNKIQEAIVFCQEEILNYIYENLIVQTVQSLNINLKSSVEDAEAKYERIVISSLQGYSLYINKVSAENIKKVDELNKKIVSASKFWKFSKSKIVPIRTAFFGLLKILCQKTSFLLENEIEHVVSTIFTNLDETEPTVLPNIWEAALLSVTAFEDWHKHVNVEKVILPKLYKVLKEGGQGNASVIYPNMLPFISNLPLNTDSNIFYSNFFDNMRMGLKQRTTLASRSEAAAVSVTLIECLQFIIMKNQSNMHLCEKLIKTQLIPMLEWCLKDGPAFYKTLFNQVAGLIQYWHRNRQHPDVSNYQKYLEYFWNNLDSLFQGLLMNLEHNYEKNAVVDLGTRQVELLTSFKHTIKPRKQMKVTFEIESPTEGGDLNNETKTKSDKCDESYHSSLNTVVFNLCHNYVKFINEKQSKEMLDHLYALVLAFENKEFFVKLTNLVSGIGNDGKLIDIYDKLLFRWLKSSYLYTSGIIDLTYILFKYLEDSEKLKLLETFTKLNNQQYGCCIANALSFPYYCDPIVQQWLSNENVDEYLMLIAKKELILGESTPESTILLKKVFTELNNGELFISDNAVFQIIKLINICLLNPSEHSLTLDTCASLAAYISSTLYTENLKLRYGTNLLVTLFTLSCNTHLDLETITEDTLWEVNTAWQDVIGTLSCCLELEELKSIAENFATIIENEFINNDILSFNSEQIVDKIVNFIRVIKKNKGFVVFKILELFLERDFVSDWRSNLTQVCVCAEYIRGQLSSLYCPVNNYTKNVDNEEILKYFIWLGLTIDVLLTPIESVEEDDDIDEEEEEMRNYVKEVHTMIDVSDNIYNVMVNLLYDVRLTTTVKENYKTIKSYSRLVEISESFIGKLRILMSHLDTKTEIERILLERVMTDGWLWAKVIYFLNSEISVDKLSDVYSDYLNKDSFQDEICQGRVHLTQAFAENISFDDILYNTRLPERLVTLCSLIHRDDVDATVVETFRLIETFKRNCGKDMYNLDLTNWERTETIIQILRLCSIVMKNNKVQILNREHWDLAVISLASWCTKLPELRIKYQNIQVASFLNAIIDLFMKVELYLKDLEKILPENEYIQEWRAVFAQDVHTEIIATWLYLSERFLENHKNELQHITYLPFIQQFGASINALNSNYVFKISDERTPKWTRLLKTCCTLLINPIYPLQLWGYNMLMILVPGLIDIDSLAVNCSKPHKKELIFEQFRDLLTRTQDIVHTMLFDFRLGENSCRVEPYTDSYIYTFAYLLLWDILLTMCEKASTELRYQYADWLRNEEFLSNLLNNIFKLIPVEVLHYNDIRLKPFDEWFIKKFELSLTDSITSNKIERMVCWVYSTTVTQLPASVRQWWSSIDTRINQVVDRITSAYVSPQLCSQELADVAQHENKFKNMVIKIHQSVREIVAVYTVDEAQMDLVITLPINYPLGGPDVQCNKQIGGTTHKQWLMQFKMCVLHQNGRIWDGLSLWNNNLDKKFDGVEECYICFAVLHPGTYQLPKLSCQTCKKKFHSACLYKWFSTSNKSTCPICRNLF